MTQRFTTSQWVPFPVEQVFAFFADPANLPRLMPGSLKTKVNATRLVPPTGNTDLAISSRWTAAGVGSEIDISFRPFPFVPYRVRWTARIAEFVWNDHFCDEQLRGPFASFRHCHVIHAEARQGVQGSLVDDEIEFRLPFGVLGQAAGLFVRLNLKTSFRQRQDQLLRMLSAELRNLTLSGPDPQSELTSYRLRRAIAVQHVSIDNQAGDAARVPDVLRGIAVEDENIGAASGGNLPQLVPVELSA
jgi:ligand-binding SRPBCC domain-containing protein